MNFDGESFGVREIAGGIVAVLVAVAVLLAAYVVSTTPDAIAGRAIPATQTADGSGNVILTITGEQSASDIGAELESMGVIRSGRQFATLVELMGVSGLLAAGDHLVTRGASTLTVVQTLTVQVSGPTVKLTFPEGLRYEEMAVIVEESGLASAADFIAAVQRTVPPDEIAATLPEGAGLQGYLFPDTYILPVGSTADELVRLMLATFLVRFTPELREEAASHGLNMHQAVTLAAIVEREAVLAEERARIAGVFYNRLAAADLLQADPTVQYSVAELDPLSVQTYGWWKQELTVEDLAVDSTYNTYKYAGLPPGPITNPGLAPLEAVAMPEETDYYYFVADAQAGDGSHVFAVTFEEHVANQQRVGSP